MTARFLRSVMGDSRLFYNQYLISKTKTNKLASFNSRAVGEFTLYTHSAVGLAENTSGENKLFLIGFCFDYRNPNLSNQQIADSVDVTRLSTVLSHLRHLSGVYVVILKVEDSIFIIPDMCAFREVYYQNETAASSPNLLGMVNEINELDESIAQGFFASMAFRSTLMWVGEETSYAGVKRLKPNHYLNLICGQSSRFFPIADVAPLPVQTASTIAGTILRGTIEAVTKRGPAMMGLTAGWDSRAHLAASRAVKKDILYFLTVHKNSKADAAVSKRLAEDFDLNYFQNWYASSFDIDDYSFVSQSLPNANLKHPGLIQSSFFFKPMLSISGAGSEIARMEFGNIENLDGKKLAKLAKYHEHPYPIAMYNSWLLQHHQYFKVRGYKILDFFYWEEILGNRGAKSMSEAGALGRLIFPAFNCLELMETMLSVDQQHRQKQNNLLYRSIITNLWADTLRHPINPSFRKRVIKYMQLSGVYDLYRTIFPAGFARSYKLRKKTEPNRVH